MGLNDTPMGERIHIGLFGTVNSGKSSLMNAITGQKMAIVSQQEGTTTDPVYKSMELLPLGPVTIIDTPGLNDESVLGAERISMGMKVLNKTDIAVVVIDVFNSDLTFEAGIIKELKERKLPFIVAVNKIDTLPGGFDISEKLVDIRALLSLNEEDDLIPVSALTGLNINELKEKIAAFGNTARSERRIVGDLINANDVIVLVVPIDKAAPKGRLILPQQQTIRDILEAGAMSIVCRETELSSTISSLSRKPALVITDSQVFPYVSKVVPEDIPLTSFSILFARFKGELETLVNGANALSSLKENDKVLISEGCTHHRQCNDIGTVKLPGMIKKYCGKELDFEFTSGGEFPQDLKAYSMVIHCGGCMLNEKEMKHRILIAAKANIPITNYGTAIAHMTGILKRSLSIFEIKKLTK